MHARQIRWFRPSTFALATLAVLLTAVVLYPLSGPLRFGLEALVYLMLALACASWPPVRRVVARLGWPRLAFFALAFAVAAWAQLSKSYGPLYPFVRWTMYAQVGLPPAFVRYEVTTAGGRTIPFPLRETTPSKSPRAFLTHFNHALAAGMRAEAEAGGAPATARGRPGLARLERLLTEVALVYNQRHPADPIREVHARVCTIPLHDYAGPESVGCETVLSFALPEEAAP